MGRGIRVTRRDARSFDYAPIIPYMTLYIAVSISFSIFLSIRFSIVKGDTRSLDYSSCDALSLRAASLASGLGLRVHQCLNPSP